MTIVIAILLLFIIALLRGVIHTLNKQHETMKSIRNRIDPSGFRVIE